MDNYIFLFYNSFSLSPIVHIYKNNLKINSYVFPILTIEALEQELLKLANKYEINDILIQLNNNFDKDIITKNFNNYFNLRFIEEGDMV